MVVSIIDLLDKHARESAAYNFWDGDDSGDLQAV